MHGTQEILQRLYQSRLEDLRALATEHDLPRSGNVEQLRATVISALILPELNLDHDSILKLSNSELGEILAIFGIKRSGSIKAKRQRLWLHLNHDPKKMTVDQLFDMTRDELHALCVKLGLPRSGTKNQLTGRVAGVLSSHDGGWGRVKKSLRRPKQKRTPAVERVKEEIEKIEPPTPIAVESQPAAIPVTTPEEVHPQEVQSGSSQQTLMPESTIDEGDTEALVALESRMPELTSHLRDFLLIVKMEDEADIIAFMQELGRHGFGIEHQSVQNRVLEVMHDLIALRRAEEAAQSALPGSWRERQALRLFEELRPSLLDNLEQILTEAEGDLARSRMEFELAAGLAGLNLDLPAVSGRLHALFDLQVSLQDDAMANDPVVLRRQKATEVLFTAVHEASPEARRTLQRFEQQIESFERVVETILRRHSGRFTAVEQSLLIRFLERRGWDSSHPEVRPRVLAAAGTLAQHMGYIDADDVPSLPSALVYDADKIGGVVESLQEMLVEFGRQAPTEESVTDPSGEGSEERSRIHRVRGKMDGADALLARLSGGFGEQSE
jgi:hypothetical protein